MSTSTAVVDNKLTGVGRATMKEPAGSGMKLSVPLKSVPVDLERGSTTTPTDLVRSIDAQCANVADYAGLDEYLYWCEDMGLAPILDVYAGFSLGSGGNTPFTGDALKPYIDEVLNELEVRLPPSLLEHC